MLKRVTSLQGPTPRHCFGITKFRLGNVETMSRASIVQEIEPCASYFKGERVYRLNKCSVWKHSAEPSLSLECLLLKLSEEQFLSAQTLIKTFGEPDCLLTGKFCCFAEKFFFSPFESIP